VCRKLKNKINTIVGESHSREKICPFGKVAVIGETGQPILRDEGISVVKLCLCD
jgi:hypothetical protein